MNEQRLQDYLNLIQALLYCANGEENNILMAHQHLIDASLVQVMEQVATMKAQYGEENESRFLTNLANEIATLLEDYHAFLEDVLQVFFETKGDTQVVYALLSANRDKLNDILVGVYPDWASNALWQVEPERVPIIAADIGNLSNLITTFPLGNKANNLEIKIITNQLVSKIFTREKFSQDWATGQNNLGNAYLYREKGDKAENLEKAIECYEQALLERTRDKFPYEWAMAQDNLGTAYKERLFGDKAGNMERAITYCQQALLEYTRNNFPYEWAKIQNNLGNIYSDRIKGDKAENFEIALEYYKQALLEYTRDKFPYGWANTQNNLGVTYNERLKGDIAENLERAIECHEQALLEYTRDKFPDEWAGTQNNLGLAYLYRLKGDIAENLERAIAFCQQALQEYTRDKFPYEWAITQNNLGDTYSNRLKGNKAENLERAIEYYKQALLERTRDKFPQDWALTQNNLGSAYSNRLKGNKAENLERAIANWRSALEIHTPTTFPLSCFKAGGNLGDAAFIAGKWEIAIEGYTVAIDAVEESRTQAMTDNRRQEIVGEAITLYDNIVQSYINLGQIDKAIEYADRSRSKRLVDLMASNDLYAGGEIPDQVREYLQQHDTLQAQIDAERERLRRQSDSSKQQTHKNNLALTRAALEAASETIAKLEEQKEQVWEQMRRLDPVLAGQIKVNPLDFATIQQLIDQRHTAILNFFTTDNDTYIFIIYKDKSPQLHTCIGFGYQTLGILVASEWLNPYINKKKDGIWYENLSEFLLQLAEKMQLKTLVESYLRGIEELIIIPHLFWHQIPFAALPLAVSVVNSQPPENHSSGMIRQVIETFTRLEKKKTNTNVTGIRSESEIISTQYLGDKFRLRYVPSSQILKSCQERPQLSQINYGIVENPDGTLPNAEFECEKIVNLYNISVNQRLKGRKKATVSNYRQLAKQVQVLHSSHHAQSRLDNPLESVLMLADGNITLGQIMTPGFRLPNLSDVFLSCCETNLAVAEITDDILSLSTGFLCAGARSVVSTLWAVDDLATALFSIFYYEYRQQRYNRPEALRQAQFKLRSLTGETLASNYHPDLDRHLKQQLAETEKVRKEAKAKRDKEAKDTKAYQKWDKDHNEYNQIGQRITKLRREVLPSLCRESFPFANPYYWAGFISSGLR